MRQETDVLDLFLMTGVAWDKALPFSGLSFLVDDSPAPCSVMVQLSQWLKW